MEKIFTCHIQTFYEDADVAGVVFHSNYLKYFERARSLILGVENTVDILKKENLLYTIYKADQLFSIPVFLGETMEIRSRVKLESEYRMIWHQEIWKDGIEKPAVTAEIHVVCIDRNHKLAKFPQQFYEMIKAA